MPNLNSSELFLPKPRIQLLAIDLDGTLLDSRWQISAANLEALGAAVERGVQVVIVTGRRYHSARQFVDQLPFPVTVISSNGARIGTAAGEAPYRNFLPAAVAREVLHLSLEYRPYAVAIFDRPGRGQVTMQREAAPDGPRSWYLRTAADALLEVADLEQALDTDPVQIMFGGPPATLEALDPLLRRSAAAPRVHLTWTRYLMRNVSLLDVMNRGCSKGTALRRWTEHCGVAREQVMAIGDNHNDLEMLQFAGCPVVMGNRADGLGNGGWAVTLSNDEHGVAEAIRRFILAR